MSFVAYVSFFIDKVPEHSQFVFDRLSHFPFFARNLSLRIEHVVI